MILMISMSDIVSAVKIYMEEQQRSNFTTEDPSSGEEQTSWTRMESDRFQLRD